jgi:hypothetical protein
LLIKIEAESKENHSLWDLMPELAFPYVYSNTYHGQPHARVDLNLLPESTLSHCQGIRIWPLKILKKFYVAVLKNSMFFLEDWKHLR